MSFNDWMRLVNQQICRLLGVEKNDIPAPYAKMYQENLSPMMAALKAIDYYED